MRSTHKTFIGKMRKTVLSLKMLVEQAEEAYRHENDTHNTLKQVLQHQAGSSHCDREQGFLDGCERDRAQNGWLFALVSKQDVHEELVAARIDLKALADEAIEMIAASGEADAEFVRNAKILTVLASAWIFEAQRWGTALLVEKPRLSVDEKVLLHRYARAEHEFRVVHSKSE